LQRAAENFNSTLAESNLNFSNDFFTNKFALNVVCPGFFKTNATFIKPNLTKSAKKLFQNT